jgi:hypothetical protein
MTDEEIIEGVTAFLRLQLRSRTPTPAPAATPSGSSVTIAVCEDKSQISGRLARTSIAAE